MFSQIIDVYPENILFTAILPFAQIDWIKKFCK